MKGRHPKSSSDSYQLLPLLLSPPKSSIKQLSKSSHVTPGKEGPKYSTLTTLLGFEGKETLENID